MLIRDLTRGIDTPLPLDAVNAYPVWNPDGSEIVFDTALDNGPWDIYRFKVDGTAEPELRLHSGQATPGRRLGDRSP